MSREAVDERLNERSACEPHSRSFMTAERLLYAACSREAGTDWTYNRRRQAASDTTAQPTIAVRNKRRCWTEPSSMIGVSLLTRQHTRSAALTIPYCTTAQLSRTHHSRRRSLNSHTHTNTHNTISITRHSITSHHLSRSIPTLSRPLHNFIVRTIVGTGPNLNVTSHCCHITGQHRQSFIATLCEQAVCVV